MAKVTALALATVMTLTATAAAQEWPTRPVTMVVPFTAGGPVDVAARLIAPRVSESLGQQIVVENMGGAGGMTGSNRVVCNTARPAPDPPRISLACCSITAWARMSPMFPTAALGRRCRI